MKGDFKRAFRLDRLSRADARAKVDDELDFHIDLMVVAEHSSQGIVRKFRAYPDGRVDGKPWAAWARMQAPSSNGHPLNKQ